MSKLEERLKDMFEMQRQRKYSRDGLIAAGPTVNGSTLTLEPINRPLGYQPVKADVLAIEVFLSRVEKDLFAKSTAKEVSDNLSGEERTALKKFRSTPFEERDLIVRLQDKSNNFVFLDNKLDADIRLKNRWSVVVLRT